MAETAQEPVTGVKDSRELSSKPPVETAAQKQDDVAPDLPETVTRDQAKEIARNYASKQQSRLDKKVSDLQAENRRLTTLAEASSLTPEQVAAIGKFEQDKDRLITTLGAGLPELALNQLRRSKSLTEFMDDLEAAKRDFGDGSFEKVAKETLDGKAKAKLTADREPRVDPAGPIIRTQKSVEEQSDKEFEQYWSALKRNASRAATR